MTPWWPHHATRAPHPHRHPPEKAVPSISTRDTDPTPYKTAAETYWDAGWRGILPIPARTKRIAITGYTGWAGATPTWPDIQTWIDNDTNANIALRMPPNVLGIDVDHYDGKPGAATLADCETRWGPLPPTWRVTSRDDGISGIRFFQIPPGQDWPGQLPGGGVETVHTGHRYAIVHPSIHPEGRTYRWIDPHNLDSLTIPRPDQLPALPIIWVANLSRGPHTDQPKSDLSRAAITTWLGGLPGIHAPRCPLLTRYTTTAITGMVDGTSRHDHLLTSLLQVVRFAASGHTGLEGSIKAIRQAFLDAVTLDKSRTPDEALLECERALAGAVALVSANPADDAVTFDPCRPPVGTTNPPPRNNLTAPPAAALSAQNTEKVTPSALTQLIYAAHNDTTPEPAPTTEPPRQRSTWWHVDIEAALRGEHIELPPTVLTRTDGLALLYAGRINGIIGPSESGKSWVAFEAVRQTLAAGHHALILDFEDTVPGVIGRLLTLGLDADTMRRQLRYVGPEEILAPYADADLTETLTTITADDLIVLDGFNAAMTLLGLDLMSNRDVTTFYQELLKKLMATGACIVYVDHTPKNDLEGESKGGIGAQAKRAMTSGTILKCTVTKPFGRGETGRIAIKVDKDRSGHVRAASPGGKVGSAILASTDGGTAVTVTIEPQDEAATKAAHSAWRPTVLMGRASDYLALQNGLPVSGRSIIAALGVKKDYAQKAIDYLVTDGFVAVTDGPRNAKMHVLQHPYVEGTTPQTSSDPHCPRVTPTDPRGSVPMTAPQTPSPFGEGGSQHSPQTHSKTQTNRGSLDDPTDSGDDE